MLHPLSKNHPQHELAVKQMIKPSGLFSVRLKSDKRKAELFVNSLRQFIIGVSWGGHESLVFPAMSFDQQKDGYSGNLIRFYVGLDDAESLIADLDQAFKRYEVLIKFIGTSSTEAKYSPRSRISSSRLHNTS